MSGSPKYSQAEIERRQIQQLEDERRRKAEEEARSRREAAERERKRRLEEVRRQSLREAEVVESTVEQSRGQMYPDDASRLARECSQATSSIEKADTEKALRDASACLTHITADISKAVSRKRRDDEEKKRIAELDRLILALSEMKRSLHEINAADCAKFDSLGRKAAEQAISEAEACVSKGDPEAVRGSLSGAQKAVERHLDTLARARAEWLRCKGEAESALNELRAFIEGLRADEVLMRWRGARVQAMAEMLEEADRAIQIEEFDTPSSILKRVITQADKIVAEANQAQLKAEERDYIVSSIRYALRDLGFEVGPLQAEYPDNPDSAIAFRALNMNREGVAVSVPFEGKVMYDVGGYSMQTVQRVDGYGQARACDKAQGMLEEIHTALAQRYGVNMGELMWEDKDPNRDIHAADELPTSGDATVMEDFR